MLSETVHSLAELFGSAIEERSGMYSSSAFLSAFPSDVFFSNRVCDAAPLGAGVRYERSFPSNLCIFNSGKSFFMRKKGRDGFLCLPFISDVDVKTKSLSVGEEKAL